MLHEDDDFRDRLLKEVITPTHLQGKGSAPSSADDAVNRIDKLCPAVKDWLAGSRKGKWTCANQTTCGGQHECNAGTECDADLCHLLHPTRECHWVVFRGNGYTWVKAMTLDQAIRHEEPGGVMAEMIRNKKLCADFTRADVWRACAPAIAYGRLLAPVPDQPDTTDPPPADPVETKLTEPAEPAASPTEKQPAEPAAPPTEKQPASATPPEPRQSPSQARSQSLVTQPPAGKAATKVPGAADAKRDLSFGTKRLRDGDDADGGHEDDGKGKGGSDKGKGGSDRGKGGSVKGSRYALPGESVEMTCRRIEAYVADPGSETDAFKRSILSAEELEPAERASLMVRLAGMMQEDQREARRLLGQSLELSSHFANQVEPQQ